MCFGCVLLHFVLRSEGWGGLIMPRNSPELRRWGMKWEYARETIAPVMNSKDGIAAALSPEHPHRNMDQHFANLFVGLLYADDKPLKSSPAIGLQHMVTALNGALKAWAIRSAPRNQDVWYLVRTTTTPASTFESKARTWIRWENSAILAPLSLRTERA